MLLRLNFSNVGSIFSRTKTNYYTYELAHPRQNDRRKNDDGRKQKTHYHIINHDVSWQIYLLTKWLSWDRNSIGALANGTVAITDYAKWHGQIGFYFVHLFHAFSFNLCLFRFFPFFLSVNKDFQWTVKHWEHRVDHQWYWFQLKSFRKRLIVYTRTHIHILVQTYKQKEET